MFDVVLLLSYYVIKGEISICVRVEFCIVTNYYNTVHTNYIVV